MRISLYIDEDAMSRALVAALRVRGIDVTTVGGEARKGLTDAEQLEYAALNGRVLYTFNTSDFYRLHSDYVAQGRDHAGIIFGPQERYDVGEQLRRLLVLIRSKSAEEMKNDIEFLSNWG